MFRIIQNVNQRWIRDIVWWRIFGKIHSLFLLYYSKLYTGVYLLYRYSTFNESRWRPISKSYNMSMILYQYCSNAIHVLCDNSEICSQADRLALSIILSLFRIISLTCHSYTKYIKGTHRVYRNVYARTVDIKNLLTRELLKRWPAVYNLILRNSSSWVKIVTTPWSYIKHKLGPGCNNSFMKHSIWCNKLRQRYVHILSMIFL